MVTGTPLAEMALVERTSKVPVSLVVTELPAVIAVSSLVVAWGDPVEPSLFAVTCAEAFKVSKEEMEKAARCGQKRGVCVLGFMGKIQDRQNPESLAKQILPICVKVKSEKKDSAFTCLTDYSRAS